MSEVPLSALEAAVQQAELPAARARALNALAAGLARHGHAQRALDCAQQALEIASAAGDLLLDAQSRHAVARAHFYLGDFVPALGLLIEAARIYPTVNDFAGAATAFAGVGLCQFRMGAHEDAVASLRQALDMASDQGLKTLEINVHNSLVPVHVGMDQFDDAQQHLQAGLALAETQGDHNLQTKLLHNGALLARKRGDACAARGDPAAAQSCWTEALGAVTQALALARQLHNRYDEAHSLGESGAMLRRLGRLPEADDALQATLALSHQVASQHLCTEAMLELGELRLAQDRHAEARALLEQAVAMARRLAARPELASACLALSQLLERQGDAAGALSLYKEYHEVGAAALAVSRKHAAAAGRLWLDYQDTVRRMAQYRQQAESLEAAHVALSREAAAALTASQHDALTGLLNRRGFDERLAAAATLAHSRGLPMTVAVVDVDRFKSINDVHSHGVGDEVLRGVAQLLQAHCRHGDFAGRWGGDEFVLVLVGADLEAGRSIVQRLQAALRERAWPGAAAGLKVTLSIGLAAWPQGQSFHAVLTAADRALYAAKRDGRDRTVG